MSRQFFFRCCNFRDRKKSTQSNSSSFSDLCLFITWLLKFLELVTSKEDKILVYPFSGIEFDGRQLKSCFVRVQTNNLKLPTDLCLGNQG